MWRLQLLNDCSRKNTFLNHASICCAFFECWGYFFELKRHTLNFCEYHDGLEPLCAVLDTTTKTTPAQIEAGLPHGRCLHVTNHENQSKLDHAENDHTLSQLGGTKTARAQVWSTSAWSQIAFAMKICHFGNPAPKILGGPKKARRQKYSIIPTNYNWYGNYNMSLKEVESNENKSRWIDCN